jgi:hypothetical protein
MLGGRGYALRDDLNIVTGSASTSPAFTSLPRILIQYTDPADNRPAMAVYEVLRENATYRFDYVVTAGTMLNQLSPQPLPLLPLPLDPVSGLVRNFEVDPGASYYDILPAAGTPTLYTKFTFKDRKGYDWVYRGPHNDAAAAGLPGRAASGLLRGLHGAVEGAYLARGRTGAPIRRTPRRSTTRRNRFL